MDQTIRLISSTIDALLRKLSKSQPGLFQALTQPTFTCQFSLFEETGATETHVYHFRQFHWQYIKNRPFDGKALSN
ncbi:hypothetical protein N8703_01510 [Verrucomicrobia bacterium]|nr:hypothetical protein [Verrucomicrobiota bacterium]